ncbi:MAG: DUF4349 domain-containing protein [Lacrimispora sp.]
MRKRDFMKKRFFWMILLIPAVLLLSACAGKKTANSLPAVASYDVGMDTGTAEAPAAVEGQASVHSEEKASTLPSGPESVTAFPAGRKLIRNISMNVETDTYDALISDLQTKITGLGGYIEQSDMSGNSLSSYGHSSTRYASITARIPADKADSFMAEVESSGNVTNKSESTQDVTLQYSDLESRKKSLEIEQDKLWEFLKEAESVDTVITLEQRLSEIRYQLESMESQMRLYDNQVDYSTVRLNISEVTVFSPVAAEPVLSRISKGLASNLKALKTVTSDFLIGLITTIPFWLPIALIAGIVVCFRRKLRKKKMTGLPKHEKEKEEKDITAS